MHLRKLVWILAAAAAAISLQAHPGHAPFSEGVKHFVGSPAHVVPAILFAALLCAAAQFFKERGERIFLRGIAAALVIGALIF